ncbi:MAG: DegV family protein, partial [Lachnospiraceae bacterium]|nr:DegV family protein [Lachnospiraceae bacterium]
MGVSKKFHGNQASVVIKYVKELEPLLKKADSTRIFVTHSCNDATIVNAVVSYLNGLHHFKEVLVTNTGGVISSHCGPDTLGVMFYQN